MKYKKTIIGSAAVLCLLLIAYFGITVYFERSLKEEIDKEISNLSSYADIGYEDIRVEVIGKRIYLNGVTLTPRILGEQINIDEIMFFEEKTEQNDVKETHVKLTGIRLDTRGDLTSYMTKIGYSDINANLMGNFVYDTVNRDLNLKQLTVSGKNMGEAELNFHLQNINFRSLNAIPKNVVILLAMISGVKIAGAEFKYTDNSLIRKLYEFGASQSNKPVEKFLEDITDRIDKLLIEIKNPNTQRLLKRIRKFLISPDKITIRIKPRKPLPIVRLYFLDNPEQAIEMLGLSVES